MSDPTDPPVVRAPDCPVDRLAHGTEPCEGPGTHYCDSDLWGSDCRRYFERQHAGDLTDAELVAEAFHNAYERLAPSYGYKTREASAKPWADVPLRNKRLMVAVAQELLDRGVQIVEESAPTQVTVGELERLLSDDDHECCPDCGDDPADHTLHAEGCPRVGLADEYQCGPPWRPLPTT